MDNRRKLDGIGEKVDLWDGPIRQVEMIPPLVGQVRKLQGHVDNAKDAMAAMDAKVDRLEGCTPSISNMEMIWDKIGKIETLVE